MCRTVPSILPLTSRNSGESLPKRETVRGWSWLFQYSEFHPRPCSPVCQWVRTFFKSTRLKRVSDHLPVAPPALASTSICSNWNTICSSWRSKPVYRAASSTLTQGVSPTVITGYLLSTSRFISRRNSCTRGPFAAAARELSKPPAVTAGSSGKERSLEIRLITSMRKPSTPLSSQNRIMS